MALDGVDEGALSSLASSALRVEELPGRASDTTLVHGIDLASSALLAKLSSQIEVLQPATSEHVFAAGLIRALDEKGQTNVAALEALRHDTHRGFHESPESWRNQHAAWKLDNLVAERVALIDEACRRVHTALSECEPLPTNVNAALVALGEHKRLRTRVLPSERWRPSLNGAYQATSLWVMTSIADFLSTSSLAVRTPASILGACDEQWMLGSLSASSLSTLRQACATAEAALDVAYVDASLWSQVAQLEALHSSLQARVADTQRLVRAADAAQSYVAALRRRCHSARLPAPEEWTEQAGQRLSLATIVGFVEARESAAGAARVQHEAALAVARQDTRSAQTAAAAGASLARDDLNAQLARLRAEHEEDVAEIRRLQQLLVAARVEFEPSHRMPMRADPPARLGGPGSPSGSVPSFALTLT